MSSKFEPLFKSDSDWKFNACLNFQHDMTYGYVEGYKIAAETLVEKIGSSHRNQDFLAYPIVFLYRHHIELLLKGIIDTGRKYLKGESGFPKHHKIENLWPEVKGMARKIIDQDISHECDFVDHVIREMSSVDPDSMSFRYATDKQGEKAASEVTNFSLKHFSEQISKASEILDNFDNMISISLDHKNEFMSDFGL